MQYRKIRVTWKENKNVLNREFYLAESVSVFEFALTAIHMFRMTDDAYFYIGFNRRKYAPGIMSETYDMLEDLTWEAMPQRFTFGWNNGESWLFDVFVYSSMKSIKDDRSLILISGNGAGIRINEKDAYMQYAAKGTLPHNDSFEEGFLPENMQEFASPEETAGFDIEKEQKRMDGFMKTDLLWKRDEFEPESQDIWLDYNNAVDALMNIENWDDPIAAQFARTILRAFLKALEMSELRGPLPEFAVMLSEEENGPEDVASMFTSVSEILMDAGYYEECLRGMEKIRDRFPHDFLVARITGGIILNCLCETEQYERCHELLDEWDEERGSGEDTAASRAYVLSCEGKYDEAEQIISRYIDENTPADEKNYAMCLAAEALYEKTDPAKAEVFRKKCDLIEDLLYPEYDDDFGEINEELWFAVRRFMDKQTEIRYSLAAACFVILCQDDGCVIVPMDDGMIPVEVYSEDGKEYVAVCSCPDAAEDAGYHDNEPVAVSDVVNYVLESDLAGICIDPDESGVGLLITRDTIEEIVNTIGENRGKGDRIPLMLS